MPGNIEFPKDAPHAPARCGDRSSSEGRRRNFTIHFVVDKRTVPGTLGALTETPDSTYRKSSEGRGDVTWLGIAASKFHEWRTR